MKFENLDIVEAKIASKAIRELGIPAKATPPNC